MTTPNYALDEMASNSLQPSVPFNLTTQLIDAIIHLSPEDKDLTADPTTSGSDVGKTWIVAAGGSGDWTGHDDEIAICTAANAWRFVVPAIGMRAYVRDEAATYVYKTGGWELGVSAAEVSYNNGTSGLTATNSQAAIDEIAALAGASGVVMTHISTYTVSGSAVTSFSISGLDLAADECYELHCKFDNATGSSASISMTYNADTTATNYYRQGVTNNSTTVTSSRGNDALIATMDASEPANAVIRIKLDADGQPRATSHTNYGAAASIKSQRFDHVWTSATNPTGINFSSSVASSLAIGSEVKVYRIKEP